MKAILQWSGRVVEVEQIDDDPDHLIVFGIVSRRTVMDAMGFRPVHVVPRNKLEMIEEDNHG
jgi:hypothetical protein